MKNSEQTKSSASCDDPCSPPRWTVVWACWNSHGATQSRGGKYFDEYPTVDEINEIQETLRQENVHAVSFQVSIKQWFEAKACAAPVCSACGGLSMVPGEPPHEDVMNTPCPACNPWAGVAVLLAVHQICNDKWQAMFAVEHQTIGFGPLCESEDECQWWCSQFKTAMSKAGARFSKPNAEVCQPEGAKKL